MKINSNQNNAITITDKLTDFMISGNIDAMTSILDKNFTLTHITGYVQSKSEWLQEILSESMKYYGYESVGRKVRIKGNKAEVVQQNKLDARIWGSRNIWRLQQTFHLERFNESWVILNSVATTF